MINGLPSGKFARINHAGDIRMIDDAKAKLALRQKSCLSRLSPESSSIKTRTNAFFSGEILSSRKIRNAVFVLSEHFDHLITTFDRLSEQNFRFFPCQRQLPVGLTFRSPTSAVPEGISLGLISRAAVWCFNRRVSLQLERLPIPDSDSGCVSAKLFRLNCSAGKFWTMKLVFSNLNEFAAAVGTAFVPFVGYRRFAEKTRKLRPFLPSARILPAEGAGRSRPPSLPQNL